MDRHTRKDLKTDKFAQEVGQSLRFLAGHKSETVRYAIIGLVVIVAAAGYWIYSNRQATTRAKALADAIHVADAVVSPTPQPPTLNFATQEEKDKAILEAYSKVAAEYRGTIEGAIAQLYVAAEKTDKGETQEAVKLYREVADSAPTEYKRVAQLALAELLAGQNQTEEAEMILRSLMTDSSALVSKEQAELALGKVIAKRDPAEARKILEPLREARPAISSAAVAAIATLPPVEVRATPLNGAEAN
jgi:hypothetical protein